jgi:hypothetical protein
MINYKKETKMDIIKSIKGWASALTDVGVSLIALGIVLEVLFNGQGIPFWPNISVIGNVQGILAGFSSEGLLGLVAVWVLYHIYKSR